MSEQEAWSMVDKIPGNEREKRLEAELDTAELRCMAAEADNARLREALTDVSTWDAYVGCGDDMRKRARAALAEDTP